MLSIWDAAGRDELLLIRPANISPTSRKYLDAAPCQRLFDAVLEKARRLPGVTAAAMNDQVPFEWTVGDFTMPFRVIGVPPPEPGHEPTFRD